MPPRGVIELRMWHLEYLCRNMREDEREQLVALSGMTRFDPEVAALGFLNSPGPRFTLIGADGTPLVAGGYIPCPIEGVFDSWMVGTQAAWDTHWRDITRATRWLMDGILEGGGRRLQTIALASRSAAIEWYIRSLWLEPDGIARQLGRNGEDAARFVRLKEDDDGQR
jgi:hypothetical protein